MGSHLSLSAELLVGGEAARIHGWVAAPLIIVIHRVESNSSRTPSRRRAWIRAKAIVKTSRHIADLDGYALTVARTHDGTTRVVATNPLHRPGLPGRQGGFRAAGYARRSRVSTHSRSIGLFMPSAPRFITWRYVIVVLTSR